FPHNWDAILLYETQSRTLFGSDLGTHGGQREAVTDEDRSEEVLALQQRLGYISPGPHVSATLARLRQLPITCLATMHGSALCGSNIHTLFTALEHSCGTISGPAL
ncbi:MAG TPA: hypothetical protein VI542_16190, partial [Candidatus Tectomicrobia bacterium]